MKQILHQDRVPLEQAPRGWRAQGACVDVDPELFFPIGTTGPAVLQVEEAKAVCAGCPVLQTCRQWALETGQEYGVSGGLSAVERRALKRREARARKAMGTTGAPRVARKQQVAA